MLLPLISGNKNGKTGLNMKNKIDNRNNCYTSKHDSVSTLSGKIRTKG
jgi:hypothetical protein